MIINYFSLFLFYFFNIHLFIISIIIQLKLFYNIYFNSEVGQLRIVFIFYFKSFIFIPIVFIQTSQFSKSFCYCFFFITPIFFILIVFIIIRVIISHILIKNIIPSLLFNLFFFFFISWQIIFVFFIFIFILLLLFFLF